MTKEQENAAYYAVIPAPVRYDPELSPSAKLLYCEITSLCNRNGYCWATNEYFTRLFALSASTISRLISQLERRGHIRVNTVAVKSGSERRIYADVYRVERIPEEDPEGGTQKQQAPQGGTQKPQGGVSENSKRGVRKNRKQNDYQGNDDRKYPPYSPPAGDGAPAESKPEDKPEADPEPVPKSKSTRREKSMPDCDPESFEVFWAAYPRKDGRKAAIRAWDKLKPDKALCRTMYAALKRQRGCEQWIRDGGQYIPHLSTWLNGRKWEDQGVDPSLLGQPRTSSGGWAPDPEVST